MIPLRACLFALICLLPMLADAGDWAHQQKITIDTTAKGADLKQGASQVPVAVRLHTGNFAFADVKKPDVPDIRFLAADGKTPLKFHFEQFDPTNELAVAWVQLPKISGNAKSDSFVMEWGNTDAVSSADAKGTYDSAQIFVLHLSDKEGVLDTTANGNNAREASAKPVPAGPLGSAIGFGGDQRIVLPASPSLKTTAAGGLTFTAWVKPSANTDGKLFSLGGLSIRLVGGLPTASLGTAQLKASTPLKPGIWQHLAITAGAGKLNFYEDGKDAGNGDFALSDQTGDAIIGDGYKGELDEITLAGVERSADYIKTLAVSQAAESAMLVFDEGEGSESTSYFSILLGAVTVDGWVIIGILIVMFVISVAVMVGKTHFLLRVRKANETFLSLFKEKSEELLTPGTLETAALAATDNVKHSPIYRLYKIGLHEIKHRFDTQANRGEAATLSAAALDSIRASMDGGMVRESQRLNSQIVLLTIAISGGPFLGLLGTVVGVMITFAAIAAAGDVNVNSIAPGIAAALVATVAGLAVAIPALFGYNWLASQIKEVTADTQVFSDEFLTKAAELYSR